MHHLQKRLLRKLLLFKKLIHIRLIVILVFHEA
jgi:hypothetical protein